MKEVFKPWGKEVWLELNDKYCYKRIYLNSGTKTSYQLHEYKLETNYIISGEAEVWLEDDAGVVQKTLMHADDFFTVYPLRKHRVVAITDVVLQEVSTPEVNDVIRLEDDFLRHDGKIVSEHSRPAMCILAAGKGTRLDPYTKFINKALLPLDNKAVISHIIDNVPIDFEVVVVLGYKGDMVEEYCLAAHPDRDFTFVTVDDYEGETTGPGYSINQAKEHLQRPFYFITVDTVLTHELGPISGNWLGTAPTALPELYSTVEVVNNAVVAWDNKSASGYSSAFIGLASVLDYGDFWDRLDFKHGEIVTAFYMSKNYDAKQFVWHDVGTVDNYLKVKEIFEDGELLSIPKTNGEFLYMVDGDFIKLFSDTRAIANRIKRADDLRGFVPELKFKGKYVYSYEWIGGNTLYVEDDPLVWKAFLSHCQRYVWEEHLVDITEECTLFYFDKTHERIDKFMETRSVDYHGEHVVNGISTLTLDELIANINWDRLQTEGVAVERYHGDLQFDNVILGYDDKFYGLDWRHDFGGNTQYGDVYYDLAKMYGGLLMPYNKMKDSDNCSVTHGEDFVSFSHVTTDTLLEFVSVFEKWVVHTGYDLERVKLITALIYLNMAPLHEATLGDVLFFKSKLMLQEHHDNTNKRY